MGDVTYHFRPDDAGRHVATIFEPDHISRFLQITEGYRMLGAVAAPIAAPVVSVGVATTQAAPVAPSTQAAHVQDAAPVTQAATATVTAPTSDAAQTATTAEVKALDQLDDEELRAVFQAELGRAAHHKAKPETMIAQIEAIRAERAAAK
jgi:hypothetical protein